MRAFIGQMSMSVGEGLTTKPQRNPEAHSTLGIHPTTFATFAHHRATTFRGDLGVSV